MKNHINLVYIGDRFYWESETMMSSIYTEDGERYDWGKVALALKNGHIVTISPAKQAEADLYEAALSRLKMERK